MPRIASKQQNSPKSEKPQPFTVTPLDTAKKQELYSGIISMFKEPDTFESLQENRQNKHTPFLLCLEIIKRMNIQPGKKILVISALEFIPVLIDQFGIDKDDIFFLDEGRNDGKIKTIKMAVLIRRLAFRPDQILSIEGAQKMKFDYIVGNPPFSMTNPGKTSGKRSIVLYPEFYKNAVLNADCVAMVMPDTSNYASSAHNDFLISSNAKAFEISQAMHDTMGIIIKTWYVISRKNDVQPSNIVFTSNLENGNNLPIQKGRINLSTTEHSDEKTEIYSVPTVKGMTRRGMEMRFIREQDAKFGLPLGKFAVVFPLCVQPHGWSHCEIVEGAGQCFNINTFFIVADTIEQAQQYKDIICSDVFIKQANELKGNSGTMGLEKFKKIKI
jgi:hypothetical protein